MSGFMETLIVIEDLFFCLKGESIDLFYAQTSAFSHKFISTCPGQGRGEVKVVNIPGL